MMSKIVVELDDGYIYIFNNVEIQSIVYENTIQTNESDFTEGMIYFTKKWGEILDFNS